MKGIIQFFGINVIYFIVGIIAALVFAMLFFGIDTESFMNFFKPFAPK